jgi:hypothetical protein
VRPHSQRPGDVRAWLDQRPSLEELQAAYPAEWAAVQRDLAEIVPRGSPAELKAYVADPPAPRGAQRLGKRGQDALLSRQVRHAMALLAVRQLSLSAATGVTDGRVRFNLLNGWVAQRLLFARDLERKPVSMRWFRLLWPLLWQRRFLMPLVGPKGIYCFYSRPLVQKLADTIGDRRCVEIAAGDGTLTRFLAGEGVDITATDDHSWRDVRFPDTVVKQDAREALRTRGPEAVICSWPPDGNPFERHVFTTPTVELYIVVGSRHRFAAGDWKAYEQQTTFDHALDPELSKLVLPPELEAAVYVFRRRLESAGGAGGRSRPWPC